ncbi:thiamine pyrophosphate-binding protein [Treponema socranskii]|uniref:thiamine pyrophosphate-binding protein n=1 Tax=Treponema socranskii TaxID=53419 RepID=UPI003D6EA165
MIFHSTFKKPVLLVGSGVRSADAQKLMLEFVQKTDIPVLTTMNAVDLVQDDLKLGFIGVYGNRVANEILSYSDFVIAVGARLGLRQIGNKPEYFAPYAKLLRVDIDEYELSRTIKTDEEKHLLDAKDFFSLILQEAVPKYTNWKKQCFEAKKLLFPFDKEVGNLCIEKISSFLPKNPVVAVDVGQNECWSAQSFNLKGNDGRLMIGGGYGSMGCSLPWAIGASIANGKKSVFCVTGDGGLQMNIQELQTVFREKLPIKILVINNRVLGKISEIQELSYDMRFAQTTGASGYSVPDFKKVAEAYGIKAITLDDYNNLDLCKEWLFDNEPCLINILLLEDTKLIPKMNWNDKVMKPKLAETIQTKISAILG